MNLQTAALLACIVSVIFLFISFVFTLAVGPFQRLLISAILGVGGYYLWQAMW